MQQEILDTTMASAGAKATYTGAGTVTAGWLLSSEAAVLYGIVIGLAGWVVQLIFSFRKERREAAARRDAEAAHKADMRERELRIALLETGRLTRTGDEA